MRWPIRNQILVPFIAILLAAVATIAVSAAYLAARRSEETTIAQLNHVIETLGRSSFPSSQNVLEMMRGLSGAEFVALDEHQTVIAATLPADVPFSLSPSTAPAGRELGFLLESPTVTIGGERYFAAVARRPTAGRAKMLWVLYPETSWRRARWEAALPPLLVGAGTVVLMTVAAAWVASRLARRIRSVQQQVADIAAGDFRQLPVEPRQDEIQDLVASVNRMAAELQAMQRQIQRSERTQLLGQLAGGLAHQLRNAVTGAKLAVQIHRRRCRSEQHDESLQVALKQLALTEEQVSGLLSLGRTERRPVVACRVSELIDDVIDLVGPACEHADVELTSNVEPSADIVLNDGASLRTAVLNLVLNAIQAAGPKGCVSLRVGRTEGRLRFDVIDSGPGPSAEVADELFDPFVTGKPEGIGLGLALARRAAEDSDGTLTWRREDGRTVFRLVVPWGNVHAADHHLEPSGSPGK